MKNLRPIFYGGMLLSLLSFQLSAQTAQTLPLNITSSDQLAITNQSPAECSVRSKNVLAFAKTKVSTDTGDATAIVKLADVPGRLKLSIEQVTGASSACTDHKNYVTVYASADNSAYRQLGTYNHKSGVQTLDVPLQKDDRYIKFYYEVAEGKLIFISGSYCGHGWDVAIDVTEPISFSSPTVSETIVGGMTFTGKFTVNYSNPSGDLVLSSSDPDIVLQSTRIEGVAGQEGSREITYTYNPLSVGLKHADITVTDEGNSTYSKVLGLDITTNLPASPSLEETVNNIGLTSFQAAWQPVENATSYLLTVTDAEGQVVGEYADYAVTDAVSAEVVGLLPGTLYKYSVKTKIGDFVSEPSVIKEITTLKPVIETLTADPYTAFVGTSASQVLTIGSTDLYGDITVSITGNNADLFTLAEGEDILGKDTEPKQLHVTYTPVLPGMHIAVLTLSSEYAEPVNVSLVGKATLSLPTELSATQITPAGFTANWNAVEGADTYELTVTTLSGDAVDGYTSKNMGAETSCQITGLAPSASYLFKVVAKKGIFASGEAVSEAVTTLILPEISTPVVSEFTTVVPTGVEQQIEISASNLYGNISVAISGDDAELFALGEETLDKDAETKQLHITYTPVSPGMHTALLTLTSEYAEPINVMLTGTASMEKPVVVVGDIFENKVPVTWNAIAGATEYFVTLYKDGDVVEGYDNVKTTEANFAFEDLASAKYYVTVTAVSGDYSTTSEEVLINIISTGMDVASLGAVTVYPNPAISDLHIKGVVAKEVKIYSANGKLLISTNLTDNQIDVSSLAPGIYSILIKSDSGISRLQFIKK